MNNKWHTNYRYFLFYHLHSTSCTTNRPTWSVNVARWSEKFHNDVSTHWIKKPFTLKTKTPHGTFKTHGPHYMFCGTLQFPGTPVEKHWPTFSGALVNATVLTLLLKSFAEKKCFSSGVLANTGRFLRFFSWETLSFLAPDGINRFQHRAS